MNLPIANPIPGELANPLVSLPITILRTRGVWMGNGVWKMDDGEPDKIEGRGIVYPTTPDELNALPEGERITKAITLFWSQTFHLNDRVEYEGEEYRVIHVDPWQKFAYNRAIAQVNQIER
jgi:hypothetical protein